MSAETVLVVVSFVCFFLAIYFAMFPLYVIMDEPLRVQLLAVATSFFVGGTVIIILVAVVKIIGRISTKKDTHL
jgi:hypothetical protein